MTKTLLVILFFLFVVACSKPPVAEKKPATKKPVATETDDEQRKKFHADLTLLLEQENFDELERIAHELTTQKHRFRGGDWKLTRFYEAVGSPPGIPKQEDGLDYTKRISKLRKWIQLKPDSIYANIALGRAQTGYAWQLRGSGFADTVSDQQFADFQKILEEADATLNKMSSRANECVVWYEAKQIIGKGLGWELGEMTKLLESAISVEPLYYDIYSGHALYLLPRWHGNPGDWEAFAAQAAGSTEKKIDLQEANILYSDICWHMSRMYSGSEFFQQNKVNWRGIKKGFLDRQEKYGASIRYLNAFCLLAGSASDKATTRALMERIGDRWEPDFWIEKKYFDGYKKWAFE
ncbi:DUF4034 domain-containing protein [bacterium]|nr:DUF4034 domain-containing protein [bacterium]